LDSLTSSVHPPSDLAEVKSPATGGDVTLSLNLNGNAQSNGKLATKNSMLVPDNRF